MNDLKLLILVAIVPIVCLVGGVLLGASVVAPAPFGGSVHNIQETFDAGIAVQGYERISKTAVFVEGGADTTLTAGATVTVTAAEICDSTVLSFNMTGNTGTTTLPTVANLVADCFKIDGDAKTVLFRNTNATSASTTLMVAGSGMVLLEATTSDVIINGANSALIHLFRTSATEIVAIIGELIDAD